MSAVHDHKREHVDGESLRPKAARLDEPESVLQMRAALSGRLNAVTPHGVLGLQRTAGNASTAALLEERSPALDVVGSGGGSPLDADTWADMESRLDHDFSDVRVPTDDRAHDSARAVNAHAYTVGSNVVFQRDKYDPSPAEVHTTLARELTHVVQQRNGPVDSTPAAGGIQVSAPSDRFERVAAANAGRVMPAPAPGRGVPGGAGGAGSGGRETTGRGGGPGCLVQRTEGENEEDGSAAG